MKHNNTTKMLVFILLLAALASFAAAENLTYVYTAVSSDDTLAENETYIPSEVNVTLPNTSLNLDLINNDSTFKITIPNMDIDSYPELNIIAREAIPANQNYGGSVGLTSGSYRYIVKDAYAFNITELTSESYTVTFNYSGMGSIDPVIFKCYFNFTTNTSNTSNCTQLTTTSTNNLAYATTTGFSAFFLTDDECEGTCGGICPACSTGGPGGGGGGGGGGLGGPKIIYVTPTIEGESVRVIQGDELIVKFKGEEYHFRVVSVGHLKVQLKDLQSYLTYDLKFAETKTMGLTSFFAKEITIDMHVSNQFAILTFKIYERPKLSIPLLPPAPRQPRPTPEEIVVQRPPAVTTTPTTPAVTPTAEAPPEIPVPESPIGIWTIIFIIVFVIFLVGGLALYRARLHRLEKPPTVTRTGLEASGLPETSSEASKPAPVLKPETGPAVVEKTKPTKPVKIPHEQKLVLEKYIFHAFSMGFNKAQVSKALVDKGWPKEVVEKVLEEIKPKK
jgi:hypothetical protein